MPLKDDFVHQAPTDTRGARPVARVPLRALFNHALDNPFCEGRVESHLRYLLSFGGGRNTRIEILFDDPDQLQVLGVISLHRFRHPSDAAAVTTEVSVSRRRYQHRRGDEHDGDGYPDRGGGVDETHGYTDTQRRR